MRHSIKILTLSLLLFIATLSQAQSSLTGVWKFSKMLSKDSVLFEVSDKARMKEFFLAMTDDELKKEDINAEPISKTIDSMVTLISNSFLKLNFDSTFEITNVELFIPSLPGYAFTSNIINGKWIYDSHTNILSLITLSPYIYKYKINSFNSGTLSCGLVEDEKQIQNFNFLFVRSQ